MTMVTINLNIDESSELQMLASEIASKMRMLEAVESFDSSSMNTESQLTHRLMKSKNAINGVKFDLSTCEMIENTKREFYNIKDSFEIDKVAVKYLIDEVVKEIENFKDIASIYNDESSRDFNLEAGTNYMNRVSFLESAMDKLTKLK